MKNFKKSQRRNALIFMVVFLCMGMAAFFVLFSVAKLFAPVNSLSEQTQMAEARAEREFAEKNQEQIKALQAAADKLEVILPELGATGRQFNEALLPLIELLAAQSEALTLENWREFQKKFAYEYEKLYTQSQASENLPKQVQESQNKVMQILQEINQTIQEMNK